MDKQNKTETQNKILSFQEFVLEKKDPCWVGYKQIGTKNKNGKIVPNCVKIKN